MCMTKGKVRPIYLSSRMWEDLPATSAYYWASYGLSIVSSRHRPVLYEKNNLKLKVKHHSNKYMNKC